MLRSSYNFLYLFTLHQRLRRIPIEIKHHGVVGPTARNLPENHCELRSYRRDLQVMGAPQGLQYVLASGTSNISSHLSETFAAFISEECFGRQPMTKYASPTAKKLFLQHLRLFLEYRGENSYGAPTLLPNLVRNVIDDFMTATKETSVSARSAYMD